jgi:hypothetical protein
MPSDKARRTAEIGAGWGDAFPRRTQTLTKLKKTSKKKPPAGKNRDPPSLHGPKAKGGEADHGGADGRHKTLSSCFLPRARTKGYDDC